MFATIVALALTTAPAKAQDCKSAVPGRSVGHVMLGASLDQLSASRALTRDAESGLFAQEGVLFATDADGFVNEIWADLPERRLCLALAPTDPPMRVDLIAAQGQKRELAPGCGYKPTRRPDGFVTLWDCTEAGFQVVSMTTVRIRVFAPNADPSAKPVAVPAAKVEPVAAPVRAPSNPPIVAGLDLQPLRMDDAFVVGLLVDGQKMPLNAETKDPLALTLWRLPVAGKCVPGIPAICSNKYALAVTERLQDAKQAVFVLGEVGEIDQLKVWTGNVPGTMVLTFAVNRYTKAALSNEALRQESRGYYVEVSPQGITARPTATVP